MIPRENLILQFAGVSSLFQQDKREIAAVSQRRRAGNASAQICFWNQKTREVFTENAFGQKRIFKHRDSKDSEICQIIEQVGQTDSGICAYEFDVRIWKIIAQDSQNIRCDDIIEHGNDRNADGCMSLRYNI